MSRRDREYLVDWFSVALGVIIGACLCAGLYFIALWAVS